VSVDTRRRTDFCTCGKPREDHVHHPGNMLHGHAFMPNPQPPPLPATKERFVIIAVGRSHDVISFRSGVDKFPNIYRSVEAARADVSCCRWDDADRLEFIGWILNLDTGKTEPL
jgi:hypothetical protein